MLRHAPPLLVLALGTSALAQNSIVGKWSVQDATPRPGIALTASFAKGGKMELKIRGNYGGRKIAVNSTGTYALKGNQLTSKLTDAAPDPSMLVGLTAAQKKGISTPAAKAEFRRRGTAAGGPYGTVTFLGKDKFQLKDKRGVSTYTRVRG